MTINELTFLRKPIRPSRSAPMTNNAERRSASFEFRRLRSSPSGPKACFPCHEGFPALAGAIDNVVSGLVASLWRQKLPRQSQVIPEKAGIHIERHSCRGMAQHCCTTFTLAPDR